MPQLWSGAMEIMIFPLRRSSDRAARRPLSPFRARTTNEGGPVVVQILQTETGTGGCADGEFLLERDIIER